MRRDAIKEGALLPDGTTKRKRRRAKMGIRNSITSLSLSAALLDMWTASLSALVLFGRCRETSAMKRDIFPGKNAIASPIAHGIAQFVMNISQFRRMFSNLRFLRDRQDAILTLVTCDNLCPTARRWRRHRAPRTTPLSRMRVNTGRGVAHYGLGLFGAHPRQIGPTARIGSHE